MERKIQEIRNALNAAHGDSDWERGVATYAKELFEAYLKDKNLTDPHSKIKDLDETDLKRGAKSWLWYSKCGCALLTNYEICKRLCSPIEMQNTNYGALPPPTGQSWEGFQAAALSEAAQLVVRIANERGKRRFIA